MNIAWEVVLKPESVQRLSLTTNILRINDPLNCGGYQDLLDYLADEKQIDSQDILVIRTDGLSMEDQKYNNAFSNLFETLTDLPEITTEQSFNVLLIVSPLGHGVVEYQVSDGFAGERNDSLDTFSYSEALRLFNDVRNKGWEFYWEESKAAAENV